MRDAIGFYWTLPVPWAGFTALPEDIDAAAQASRTIRYQRDLIRRHAREGSFRLVAEKVFLEIAPDRGSRHFLDALRPLEAMCRAQGATLLLVDFSQIQGWRTHGPLFGWARDADIEVEIVYPDRILIEGEPFDPDVHFSEWRARQNAWTRGKEERVARALEAARRLRAEGRSYQAIAEALNAQGVRSATGKPWRDESIRKLLAATRG